MDWLAAAIVGALNILVMRPLSHYRFWWHWVGGRFWLVGYLLYLLVAASTGIASKVGAEAVGWRPGTHDFLHALVTALAGATLIRADTGRPLRKSEEKAKNLAAPLTTWLGAGFDHASRLEIERWANGLSAEELKEAAGRVASDSGRPGSTVKRALITAAVRELSSPNATFARGELVGLLAYSYLDADRTADRTSDRAPDTRDRD